MKLALVAVLAALSAACATPQYNAEGVSPREARQRDYESAQQRSAAYLRADNGDPGRSGDSSRNPGDSGGH